MTSRLAPESGEHRFSVGTYTPTIKTPRGALVSPILLACDTLQLVAGEHFLQEDAYAAIAAAIANQVDAMNL